MKKVLAALLVLCLLLLVSNINLSRTNPYGPINDRLIYIRSDGSIEPANSPIKNVGDNQYLLTGNLSPPPSDSLYNRSMYSIWIEKDNIILDGVNHTVTGYEHSYGQGIEIFYRNNVTIKNIVLSQFETGIDVYGSTNVNITDNSLSSNLYGIELTNSSNVVIAENNFSDFSQITMYLKSSNSTIVYGNNLSCTPTNGWDAVGLQLDYCSYNSIVANVIANFSAGINFLNSSNNYFFQNNLIGNKIQAQDLLTNESYQRVNDMKRQINERIPHMNYIWQFSTNTWNNNYWSDYNGTIGVNGVGQLPYTIDARNMDNSPLTQKETLEQVVPLNSNNFPIHVPTAHESEIDYNQHIYAILAISIIVVIFTVTFGLLHRRSKNKTNLHNSKQNFLQFTPKPKTVLPNL